jgi:hypothetical protein
MKQAASKFCFANSVDFERTTRRYTSEDRNVYENMKS